MPNDEYEKMLQAFALTKNFLKQQVELGFDEVYVQVKTKRATAKKEDGPGLTDLSDFYHQIKDCKKCHLYTTRTNFVFGAGNPEANLMLIGEAPGREEDLKGEPFVGAAGKLLDRMLAAINFKREDVFIANILKCRPPENRDPRPDEIETCKPYLMQQIKLIQPKIILALGRISAQVLLQTKSPLGQLRGKFHDFNGIKFLVTYHPAALLRYQQYKRPTWEDLKLLRKEYDKLSE
ncbi:MAG: uracil-DNA glycosylase [candidate division Zixibacteria bacterium]|nr:uracil-DNA glycosylase [candidate division Zixibacteria bacterium]